MTNYAIKVTNVHVSRTHDNPRTQKTRLYFFQNGQSILENFWNRGNEPKDEYRKVFDQVFSMIDQDETLEKHEKEAIKNAKFTWSCKAGCSMCPCSPGFVTNDVTRKEIFVDYDIVEV